MHNDTFKSKIHWKPKQTLLKNNQVYWKRCRHPFDNKNKLG